MRVARLRSWRRRVQHAAASATAAGHVADDNMAGSSMGKASAILVSAQKSDDSGDDMCGKLRRRFRVLDALERPAVMPLSPRTAKAD